MVLSPPPFPPVIPPRSPNSTDGNVDVTACAEERVRALEEAQKLANQSNTEQGDENFGEIEEVVGRVEEEEMVESQAGKPDDLSVTQAQVESLLVPLYFCEPVPRHPEQLRLLLR